MFKKMDVGSFGKDCSISVRVKPHTAGSVQMIEDVKTLHVNEREARESGIYIHLDEIADLQAGDTITITGRVGEGAPSGANWSIVLQIPGGRQIAQHIAPSPIFSLSHILEEDEIGKTLIVYTLGWGVVQPLMDFYVDGLLVTRRSITAENDIDTRTQVYSMTDDPGVQWMNAGEGNVFGNTAMILRSGAPTIRIFKRGNTNAIHVGVRVNDFDGIDINLARMNLRLGNKYKITVTGRIDSEPPEGATIMLQSVPGYAWIYTLPIKKDMEFTLSHTLAQTEIEKWTAIRITTNTPGASVSFYVYSIDIERV
jgi:hypothetical protein